MKRGGLGLFLMLMLGCAGNDPYYRCACHAPLARVEPSGHISAAETFPSRTGSVLVCDECTRVYRLELGSLRLLEDGQVDALDPKTRARITEIRAAALGLQ